jgi:hypothetical protein
MSQFALSFITNSIIKLLTLQAKGVVKRSLYIYKVMEKAL